MTNQIVIDNNPPWSLEAEYGLDPSSLIVTPSMMDAALLLHDPPSISEGGGIAPVSEWPGRWVDENDVIQAAKNGYGRDWFRYWHRYNRWEEVWGEGGVYERARAKMKPDDYFRVFDWNQRLLFGDYGAGKSTRFVALANHWAQHGIPTFHNGLYLGGRVVEGDEIFTLMQYMPKCSVLGHDEAHGTAPGRLAASTAVATLRGLGANIRKLNVDWSLIGAQYKDVHPMVLEECVEAMELKKVPVQIDDETLRHTEPWNNPANFVLAWNLWLDYPYKRMRERQRQSRRNRDQEEEEVEGFGTPDFWGEMDVEEARWAFALTDSFRLVELSAITAQRDKIKERLMGAREDSLASGRDKYQSAVIDFANGLYELVEQAGGIDQQWIMPSEIAEHVGFDGAVIGKALSNLGVKRNRYKGYMTDDILRLAEGA